MTAESDLKAIWTSALDQIKVNIGDEMFNLWFNLTFLKNSDTEVRILAPSTYVRDQLKIRYPGVIESKLRELTGNTFTLDIVVNEANQTKKEITPPEVKTVQPSTATNKTHKEPKSRHPQLKEDYTFDTFIIGNNSKYAANAALSVSKNLGKAYNPLLIYGGVGLGKTHLMQSIGNYVYRSYNNNNIIFVTAENFMNEFIESINDKKSAAAFRNKYRHVDLLMIDDIHSFKNAQSTLDELFNTYEALHNSNKQMVFTCDRPVFELKNLNDRLKNRFENGLNVDLQPPDFETRCAILKAKIKGKGLSISEDVITLVCENISSNVRDLEKALNKLVFYTQLESAELTVEIARQQLKDNFCSPIQPNVSIESIIRVVADYFSLSVNDIRGKKKTQNIVRPRHFAMYMARELTEHSTTEIGQAFGGRDHTTVISAIDKIEKKIKAEPLEEQLLESLKRLLKEYNVK